MSSDSLVINGRFLTQPVTGVQRVGIEFCRALDTCLAQYEGDFPSVEILIPRRAELVTDLDLNTISLRRVGILTGHAWEQVELPAAVGARTLLSLGNTAPLTMLWRARSRTFVMVHDLSYRYFPSAYRVLFRILYSIIIPTVLRRAALIFTVSESERNAILSAYPRLSPDRILAVQNGSSFRDKIVHADRSSRGRTCLYVGSLTRRKNAEGLIAAAVQLARDHDVETTFIGATGPSFDGVEVAIPEDVKARLTFLGQVDDTRTLSRHYSSSAAFLFPSFYEASPLPPIESMSHGCPVVASAIPSLEERCGDAALYCDPYSHESIVTTVVRLLDDDKLWDEQQDRGFAVAQSYSWAGQAQRILSSIRDFRARDN